uniref:Uncharacterized protein n=1 Tax=Oryza nivara TaxID=4536 RepID=A0A0E0I3Q8_ORYNI
MAKKKKVFIFRKAADVAMAVSAAYAPFAAAVSYHAAAAAAPAVLAFALGHGALLFMLPFSVYALAFLRAPRGLHQTPYPMLACAVAAPATLLAAVLAVPVLADDVALAWAANVSAAAALWWCLTNGGYTAVAFSRVDQYASFMDAVDRTPEIALPLVFDVPATAAAARRDAVRFAVALSAACAVAGGAEVGVLSSAAAAIAAALSVFALPMCLLYVPEYHMDPYPTIDGVLQRNPAAAWCALLAPVALALRGLVEATAGAGEVGTFATVIAGAFWAMDAGAAVLLGRVIAGDIAMAREADHVKHSIYRSSSSEIMSALLMVWVRYFVYLHVFHLIGCGGHLTWFNSSH